MRRKAPGLCALVLGASLFFTGCDSGERPNIPENAHFMGKPKHGAVVYNNKHFAIGYWNAEKNELTTIRNFQDLPEDYTTKWGGDERGRPRNFVYDNEGNCIGYLKYIDSRVERASRAQNPVEAEYYASKMIKERSYMSPIRIFVPDITKIK